MKHMLPDYLMGKKAIWLDIARVCGRIFSSCRRMKTQECIMEYHKPDLTLEQNWTVEDLMDKLRELNISFLPKFRKL